MMNIDKELVELAIDELKGLGQRASLAAVMRMTGYTYPDLIEAGYQHLARKYSKAPQATVYRPTAPQDLVQLEPTIEAYTAHLRDNYFAHPETLSDVDQLLRFEVESYQVELFRQAANKLILSNELIEQPQRKEHYSFAPMPTPLAPIGAVEPHTDEQPAYQEEWMGQPSKKAKKNPALFTYLVVDGNTVIHSSDDLEKANEAAANHSLKTGDEVFIYRKHKTLRVTITHSTELF